MLTGKRCGDVHRASAQNRRCMGMGMHNHRFNYRCSDGKNEQHFSINRVYAQTLSKDLGFYSSDAEGYLSNIPYESRITASRCIIFSLFLFIVTNSLVPL